MDRTSNKYNLNDPNDIAEVQRLLFEDDDNEASDEFNDDIDTDAEENVEFRTDDSASEQDDEEETNNNDVSEEGQNYYMGKDRTTKWNKIAPSQRIRTASYNITKKLPGVKGVAKLAQSPLQCWSCLISDDILNIIVTYTNQYIATLEELYMRPRDTRPIDLIELKAFLGLLFLAGVHRSNRQNLDDLWGSDGDGIEKFRLVMSIKRFRFLIRCLRFDDRTTRDERKQTDKLAAIREVFVHFVNNCQQSYDVGENVTIDEKLEGFRGRCSFKQYIPSKPNKYGIKIYALVDSAVYYLYNLEIYAGLQPEGIYRESNKPYDVVMRLSKPILNSGRNITADNWFSSIELIDELRKKNLTYVGTIKKNKRALPLEFVTSKNRNVHSSIFGFKKGCTIVSYVPKKGKCVILASSLHKDNAIDVETGANQKPSIITFYNKTKGGVDTTDKLCASYNVARNVRRWPMVIWFAMLNMSGINSQIIYFGNGQKVIRRKEFIKRLSHELVLPHITRRSLDSGLHLELQEKLKRYRPECVAENLPENRETSAKRKRCHDCKENRRLTKYNCIQCKKPICLMHIKCYCSECSKLCQDLKERYAENVTENYDQ